MSAVKDFIETLDGKAILVFGLGRSGNAAVKALCAAGARVVAGDDNEEHFDTAKKFGAELYNPDTHDLSDFAMLVLSPGVPLTHPKPHDVVVRAQDANVEILCDIELYTRIHPHVRTIGVTGTNGKSTTCALISHILKESGRKGHLGGNFGTPVFDLDVKGGEWLVIEISSFQIDLCTRFRPDVAVISNITPDHLDRHGSMENYVDVKERMFGKAQSPETPNIAVICTDDSHTKKICDHVKDEDARKVVQVSVERELSAGVYVDSEMLFDVMTEGERHQIGDLEAVKTLSGKHNYQNVCCAYAALKSIGLDSDVIWAGVESFPGLNHRQFLVRTINGVSYVNDSKSTNAASAAVAIGCRNNVYWIVGGRRKKNGLEGLEEFFPRIKHAFLIGESTEEFADWMDKYGMEYSRSMTLDKAVEDAHSMAQKNRGQPGGAGVVLLSPACASFDQFDSFEHRGDVFSDLVQYLEE